MVKWHSLLFILLVFCNKTFAVVDPTCTVSNEGVADSAVTVVVDDSPTSVPTKIDIVPQDQPTRLDSAGQILSGRDAISKLPDGDYIFLVYNATGEPGKDVLIVSQRVPQEIQDRIESTGQIPDKYLATHWSLAFELKNQLDVSFNTIRRGIVGSGRFMKLNGKTRKEDSRSGTFPGGEENFRYSQWVLGQFGRVVEPGQEVLTAESAPRGRDGKLRWGDHFEEAQEAKWKAQNLANKDIAPLRKRLLAVHKSLYRYFPGAGKKKVGTLDNMKLLDFIEAHEGAIEALSPQFRGRVKNLAFNAASRLNVMEGETVDLLIHQIDKQVREDRLTRTGDTPVSNTVERLNEMVLFLEATARHYRLENPSTVLSP